MSHNAQTVELKEKTSHGNMLFPIQRYFIDYSGDQPRMNLHWHDEAEWTLIFKGEAMYQLDGREYHVKAGDLLFLPPSALHMMNPIGEQVLSDTLVFDLSWLSNSSSDVCYLKYLLPLINGTKALPPMLPAEHPQNEFFSALFNDTCRYFFDRAFGFELAIKSSLLETVHEMYARDLVLECTPAGRGANDERIKSILQYLEENFAECMSIGQIAAHFNFSEYHFMRFFKKNVGITCVEYLNNLRLSKAFDMLKLGDDAISNIALKTGFNSPSYFCRVFKMKYNVTPSDVKKRV